MQPDPAEQWLRDHDPDYAESRKAWKDLSDGEYVSPEMPWEMDFDEIVPVEPINDRLCGWCGAAYVSAKDWQRFCSGRCRIAAHRADV